MSEYGKKARERLKSNANLRRKGSFQWAQAYNPLGCQNVPLELIIVPKHVGNAMTVNVRMSPFDVQKEKNGGSLSALGYLFDPIRMFK